MRNSPLVTGLFLLTTLSTLEGCSFHAKSSASAQSAGSSSTSKTRNGGSSEFKMSGSAHFQSKPRASGVGRSNKKTDFQGKALVHTGGKFSLHGSASGSAHGSASASGSAKGDASASGSAKGGAAASGSAQGSGAIAGSGSGKGSESNRKNDHSGGSDPVEPKTKPPESRPPKDKTPKTKPPKEKDEPKSSGPKPSVEPPPKTGPPSKAPELERDPPKKPKEKDKPPSKKKPEEKPELTEKPEVPAQPSAPPEPEPDPPSEIEPIDPPEEPPPNVFGYAEPVRGCFEGIVYPLKPFSQRLPMSYEPLEAISVVYACEWDIPARDWSQGFPGIEDKFEWFAIRYSGSFNVASGGTWKFRISSDDGTKLFIDGKPVIKNDGVHPPRVKEGSIELTAGDHEMVLEYFQGPRFLINLQLYATPPGGEEGIFSVR